MNINLSSIFIANVIFWVELSVPTNGV